MKCDPAPIQKSGWFKIGFGALLVAAGAVSFLTYILADGTLGAAKFAGIGLGSVILGSVAVALGLQDLREARYLRRENELRSANRVRAR